MKARKIFGCAVFAVIFFLTGCASQRYHKAILEKQKFRTDLTGAPTFHWPLQGRLIVPFGGKDEGISSKGILVEGSEGQCVYAAQEGQVIFVDESLQGYGKTLILEHSSDFSTVYARNAEILVSIGQWVRQGQVVARVGRAGKGGIPRVYFELRHFAKPEDPLRYLR